MALICLRVVRSIVLVYIKPLAQYLASSKYSVNGHYYCYHLAEMARAIFTPCDLSQLISEASRLSLLSSGLRPNTDSSGVFHQPGFSERAHPSFTGPADWLLPLLHLQRLIRPLLQNLEQKIKGNSSILVLGG